MQIVYVLSSGCVHEGGSVEGVFVREDLAIQEFDRLVERRRETNRIMRTYTLERHPDNIEEAEYWLSERRREDDCITEIVFHETDFVQLRRWKCEE